MPVEPTIKACLFDVGGVCVLSPMLAIRDYEHDLNIPAGYINLAIASHNPNGAWQQLERGEIPMNSTFFAGFTRDLTDPKTWASFHKKRNIPAAGEIPAIDGEKLFWAMMGKSREFDPVVYTAIQRLRETGRYRLGALTNDYQYPEDHPYADNGELRGLFDVFVSSSESGMRKPEHGFYRLALKKLGLEDPREVVFLDDIGANLRAAKEVGFRTIKVGLGESWKAIEELERVTGERLLRGGVEVPKRLRSRI